jgi:DNA-binding protein HU-beta
MDKYFFKKICKGEKPMNKTELVSKIAEKAGITKKDTESILNGFTEVITEALASGDKIQLVGFGTFETRMRKAKQGVNPKNPEQKISIPASKVPAFKPGKTLKESVNN